MVNQWKKIGSEDLDIQKTKNEVLNHKLIEAINTYSKGKKLFDYGCGWGEFANLMSERGFKVLGFDDADEMVSKAKERYAPKMFLSKKEFKEQKNKLKKSFDVVTSNLVLCILEKKEQEKILSEIKGLVKSDGIIVISFCHPCFDFFENSAVSKRIVDKTKKYDDTFLYEKIVHEGNFRFHDFHRPLEYYVNLFNENDLQIMDIKESMTINEKVFPDFIIFVLKMKE
ncbi:class I SAM-dependent methyltransferase [Candidatus Woesearchaeota archaeon]|jgi:2-polyprenyl-3-methyl-5-hydroxy-6-metoxy-1,4-benzoquinol methylase|nr:class I SAM-dependent methyltransferase [Candidatus Woesearchaeota archaeon]MBT6638930.1 class I SAM-dependent methyltransferase [Candidatus Woesearchaeota archaeon]MBT7134168.1 class I SAM-dependent methyltransferase [Candidatus Woesearchaeota archaeon]MBT7442048.1 class I SAM-dependent methyltransferase [Candidatus Woesearchaeota archaeon]MBT7627843.1 class I SAM-dependent methyltransferase [Candidatus Woesearchaeota archaeon]